MSNNRDLDVCKREISALLDGAIALEQNLLAQNLNAIDEEDRMEAMDILNRIERRMLAQSQVAAE